MIDVYNLFVNDSSSSRGKILFFIYIDTFVKNRHYILKQ